VDRPLDAPASRERPLSEASFERTWAVVPIRGLATAKTRLGPDLDPEARRRLVIVMLRRTLVATRDADAIRGTVVVTKDPEVAGLAQEHHAIGLVEHAPDLNAAIVAGRSLAIARGATAVLVLPADLPAVTSAAIDELVIRAAVREAPGGLVGLVTDRHGLGTNTLLTSPPAVIDPAFGPDSRAAHRAAAAAAGASWLEVGGPLALDVDTPADLAVAEATVGPLSR
jgi:2-phospho-L-lactate guanylyltransferase